MRGKSATCWVNVLVSCFLQMAMNLLMLWTRWFCVAPDFTLLRAVFDVCHAVSEEPTHMWANFSALVVMLVPLPMCLDCHIALSVPKQHQADANIPAPPTPAVHVLVKPIVIYIAALQAALSKTIFAAKRLQAPTRFAVILTTAAHRPTFLSNAPQAVFHPLSVPPVTAHARRVKLEATARCRAQSIHCLANKAIFLKKEPSCARSAKRARFLIQMDRHRASAVLLAHIAPQAHTSSAAARSIRTPPSRFRAHLVPASASPASDRLNPSWVRASV